MKLIDGTTIAQKIETRIAQAISHLTHRPPALAFILVGNASASRTYVQRKKKKCQEVGITSIDRELPHSVSETDLLAEIALLNRDEAVDGILVQLPLPPQINPFHVFSAIDPAKDIDGFHPLNMGKMLLGESGGFHSCTPQGIHILLHETGIPLLGKHVVIIGRSNIVGKPLAALLMQKTPHGNATVTIAHSLTENLPALCRSADILVAALGHPHFVKASMVKEGSTVIDVGINHITGLDKKTVLVGDVAFDEVAPLCSHITPVPGGVGPMTIAMLLSNTLLSYQRRKIG